MKDLKIEVGKFYKTRDGRKVRIYSTDSGGRYPIHGAVRFDKGWSMNTWQENGSEVLGTREYDDDIISEWEDKTIFDNWDALPAWCDYAIAMDEDRRWFSYNKVPAKYDELGAWGVIIESNLNYITIPIGYSPKDYKGDWKDSLLINPKYLQNDEK